MSQNILFKTNFDLKKKYNGNARWKKTYWVCKIDLNFLSVHATLFLIRHFVKLTWR